MKIQVNSYDPFNVVIKDLLYNHECDEITKYLVPRLGFPPGTMGYKPKKNDWTMKKYGYTLCVIFRHN